MEITNATKHLPTKKINTTYTDVIGSLLQRTQTRVKTLLQDQLKCYDTETTHLYKAMSYALLSEGKRFRPALVYALGELCAADSQRLDKIACAVELVHTFSLIHDDLPAMDNDELRRGKPTCHIMFGEATAILAGNALQCLAFECIADMGSAVITTLANAMSLRGMAGGQAIDLYYTNKTLDLPTLKKMHLYKTGALIKACVRMPTLASENMSSEQIELLYVYAENLGLVFQVYDDILDVEADKETLGKTPGKDALNNKATFVTLLGLNAAKDYGLQCYTQAMDALEIFDQRADSLRALATFAIKRNY